MDGNKIEINGNLIELYTSYEDLPFDRYNKFNKYVMKDSDIGGDVPSFVQRISKAIELISIDCKDEAIQELQNLSYTVVAVFNEYNLAQHAFACMVKKINGVAYNDLTDDGLLNTLKELERTGITQKQVSTTVDTLKKK